MMLCACCAAACSSGPLSALRFQNHDPVWVVNDRKPIRCPETRSPGGWTADVDAQVRRPLLDALAVPDRPHAWNVNALDEVPNSTWFENRIGIRDLSAEELARGPSDGGPDVSQPWIVHRASVVSELAPRMLIEDARGDRYILKLDPADAPELESGPEVVVQRLLWAAGYRVPENDIVLFGRDDLAVAKDAVETLPGDRRRPLTSARLDEFLRREPTTGGGSRWRALSSKYLTGVPIGGYPMSGVRDDDPNDRVPHEHRREVRAASVFYAWLGATDVKENNTLDMWVEDPKGSGLGYVVHHALDFGKALGTWGVSGRHEHDGYTAHFDYPYALRSAMTFGFWTRPWEDVRAPSLRGLGRFEAERFRPDVYAPANPYEAFFYLDELDAFWAAKIIARFSAEHIAAAVERGGYSDPRTRSYLTATLIARQRKLVRHHFAPVNTLDRFRLEPAAKRVRLCATDLFVSHRLGAAAEARHVMTVHDYDGNALGEARQLVSDARGEVCADDIPLGSERRAYTMVAFVAMREAAADAAVIVHLARDPNRGSMRVIGVERR
jgi:hypothetical protein